MKFIVIDESQYFFDIDSASDLLGVSRRTIFEYLKKVRIRARGEKKGWFQALLHRGCGCPNVGSSKTLRGAFGQIRQRGFDGGSNGTECRHANTKRGGPSWRTNYLIGR